MRKTQDDPIARTVAENQLADILERMDLYGADGSIAAVRPRDLIGAFKAIEFETTSRKVGDEEIPLRRLVITGPWEVNPNGK